MARKRQRVQTVRPRASNKARSSIQPQDDQGDLQQGNRLKKARFVPEQKPESAEDAAVELAAVTRKATEAKIATLQTRIDAFLKASLESRLSVLPDAELLVAIADILATVPVPTAVAKLGKVPRVLLIAARRGIDEGSGSEHRGAMALARALTTFARGADIVIPEDDRAMRTTRSAFHPTERDNFSRVELEAVQRAGKWALQLLTSCVRGEREKIGKTDVLDSQGVVPHGNISRVFVTPRDSLDIVMSEHYTSSIIKKVDGIADSRNLCGWDKLRLLRVICRKVCSLIHTSAFVPIAEGILLSGGRIEVPMKRSEVNVPNELLDGSFVECVLGNNANSPFKKMCVKAQCAMVIMSHRAWLLHLEDVQDRFSRESEMSAKEQREAVKTLAMVAAEHVNLHWEFMDEVRRAVCSDTEPFSTRLWEKRMFYRVVLSETVDHINTGMTSSSLDKEGRWLVTPLVRRFPMKKRMFYGFVLSETVEHVNTGVPSSSLNKEGRWLVTPLFRRFPLEFQQLIRSVTILANSMFRDGQHFIDNAEPGAIALYAIFDTLKLDAVRNVPPNAHAVLLCIEGVIEKLCWASGYTAALRNIDTSGLLPSTGNSSILRVISVIVTMVEVIRLPGGAWAESKQVFQTRAQALQKTLHTMYTAKHLPSIRKGEWRLSGLLGMTMCGALCASNLTVPRKFCTLLDPIECREMRRALEISMILTGNRESAKAMEALAELMAEVREGSR